MKNPPPPIPPPASYGWIWNYVTPEKPLIVGTITFSKIKTEGWLESSIVRIPVLLAPNSNPAYGIPNIFDPNPITSETVFKDFPYRTINGLSNSASICEAVTKAEKTHKKEWLAKRTRMRKAYAIWAQQNPESVKELENQKIAQKNLLKTEAIIEFSKSLTLCRSKIEHMLSALSHGTYTGKMCAELYEACNEVSSAQKLFRRKACKD